MIATKHEEGCQTSLNVCKAFDLQNTLISLLYSFRSYHVSFYLSEWRPITTAFGTNSHFKGFSPSASHSRCPDIEASLEPLSLAPLKALFDQENNRMKQHF